MMLDPRAITVHIQALDPTEFAHLCNRLLIGVGTRVGIARECFPQTLHVNDRDGGVDGRCQGAPTTAGRLIPASDVVYQYKSGRTTKSAPVLARDDILAKPRVRKALEEGKPFVYLAGWDRGDQFESEVTKAVLEGGLDVRDDQIRFIGGYNLAVLLQAVPGLVHRLFGLGVPLLDLDGWAALPRLQNPFQDDDAVRQRLEQLRTLIERPRSITRVVGAPGDGKTRTVLEALKASHLRDGGVLYGAQASEVTPEFVDYLRTTPDVICTLVVDEVDDTTAQRLADRFAEMPESVRLVTIGLDTVGRDEPGTVEIRGLEVDVLERAIRGIAGELPDEVVKMIAQSCEGSPKLAVIIASRLNDRPELAVAHRFLKDGAIRSALDQYLSLDPHDLAWQALSGVALLERVGWSENVEDESSILFRALGLNVVNARRAIEELDERFGVAPRAGRFRYVSPAVLADHLAARQVHPWTGGHFVAVLGSFTPAMADSFARRMRRLSAVLENRQTVEQIVLGEEGPFRSLADTERAGFSSLLRHLAAPFPHATLGALQRLIEGESLDALRAASACRRDMVNALEELLWREDTFEGAAWLTLRLAVAENETWANNATGVWAGTFQTRLGRTAAGRTSRVRVLRRAASDDNTESRRLTAKAIEAGLQIGHIFRIGNPPKDIDGMPEQSWSPATYGEWATIAVNYLDLMANLLNDDDPGVRIAAAETVASGVEAALYLPGVLDRWSEIAKSVGDLEYELRAPLLKAIELHIGREEFLDENPEDERERQERDESAEIRRERLDRLQEVYNDVQGDDFSSRFRRVLSRDPWATSRYEEAQRRRREEFRRLADEAIGTPELLESEWDWLLDQDAPLPQEWAQVLGEQDSDRVLARVLENLSRKSDRAIGFVSLYELGYAAAQGNPGHIDDRLLTLRAGGASSLQLFDLLVRSEYTKDRFASMLELFEAREVGGNRIGSVAYSAWREALSPEEARALIEAAMQDPDGTQQITQFVWHYLRVEPEGRDVLQPVVMELLKRPVRLRMGGGSGWEWTEVAKHYLENEPVQIARCALDLIAYNETAHEESLNNLVRRAREIADSEVFFYEVVAPWLDVQTTGGWWVRNALEHFSIDDLKPDRLRLWITRQPETRARAVAKILGAPIGDRPSDLHGMLLEEFAEHGVGETFFGGHISGVGWGSMAARTKGLLHQAREWAKDERPAVRDWAKGTVDNLEHMLQRDEFREEEERFR